MELRRGRGMRLFNVLILTLFVTLYQCIQSANPTAKPTTKPTVKPTVKPTTKPTIRPSQLPTFKPTLLLPIESTSRPTVKPTNSVQPTNFPTTPNPSFQTFDLVLLAVVTGITLGAIVASAICCCLYVVWYHRTHHIATSVEVLNPTQTHYSPLATSSHEVNVEMIEASKVPSAPPLISPQAVISDDMAHYERI
mmetsp:Transcript_15140/g.16417  ORF Transcript_15140/g.16417 Transcript_15140/m.16417 type:complete len:194 (-) Transcript_15140:232-813(-)